MTGRERVKAAGPCGIGGPMLNPRYGRFGLVVLPYYLFFELLAPVIELAGLIAVPLALVLGLLDPMFAVVVLLASVGFGMLLSLAAVVVEETAFHRHARLVDVGRLVLAAAVEVGFRPCTPGGGCAGCSMPCPGAGSRGVTCHGPASLHDRCWRHV